MFSATVNFLYMYFKEVLISVLYINLGLTIPNVAGDFTNHDMTNNPATVDKNNDGSAITSAVQVSVTNAQNYNTGRVGQASNVAPSVLNNESLEAGVYVETGTMLIDLSQAGVNPSSTYTVQLSGSRDAVGSDRVGEYTVGGVTQELDATANPVESLTFANVSGSDLIANGVQVDLKAGSTFAYITSLRVIEQ